MQNETNQNLNITPGDEVRRSLGGPAVAANLPPESVGSAQDMADALMPAMQSGGQIVELPKASTPKTDPAPQMSLAEHQGTEKAGGEAPSPEDLMQAGMDNVGKAGEDAANELFPGAMAMGSEEPATEKTSEPTQDSGQVPPATPAQRELEKEVATKVFGKKGGEKFLRKPRRYPIQ